MYFYLAICGVAILVALGFKYDAIVNPLVKNWSKLQAKIFRKNNHQFDSKIIVYKLDIMLKAIVIFVIVTLTINYELTITSIFGPLVLGYFLVIFLFCIHKVSVIDNDEIIIHRLLWKKTIKINTISKIYEQLGYFKVVHQDGCFRVTDLITGSKGLIATLKSGSKKTSFENYSFKKSHRNEPRSTRVVFGILKLAILLIGTIGFLLLINNQK